jgi:endonuclease/exonuclease/phosphatase family metal-dependent hydrolase
MTNNHVLENESQADASVAEFNFEDGQTPTVIKLQPRRVFLTDPSLDFTIVACDDGPLGGIAPIPLQRDSATITRNERASIIQHPAGRRKEVALHNNEVIRVKDTVIHYRTDTEPGSSGSPVFNNRWQLVALHHAGWTEPGGRATNEGVRISAIAARLHQLGFRGVADRELFEGLLQDIQGTSPDLGFFDQAGLSTDPREVVVNSFTGSRDFADLGYWNIEHFNSDVSAQRVSRVADVFERLLMDVMGLVEVERGALDRLLIELGHRGLAYDYKSVDGPGRQDLALLYDRDTAFVKLRPDLMDQYEDNQHWRARTSAGQTAFPRRPLLAECEVLERVGSVPLRFLFMVVHLKAFGDAASRARRELAARVLAEVIREIREQEGLPVVLGGDFNDLLTSSSLAPLRNAPDLFSMTLDDARSGDASAISYVGQSHRSLIDHIIVSGDVTPGPIMGDDAAIVRLDRQIGSFAKHVSDHIPVVFRMIYRNQELLVQAAEPGESEACGAADATASTSTGGGHRGGRSSRTTHRRREDAD